MEDAFLALSSAYRTRKLAEKAIEEARASAQVNVHSACFQVQQQDEGFAKERWEMESQIRELTRSIDALDAVRQTSAQDSWKTVDKVRFDSHNAIHSACVDLQRTDTLVQDAHDVFDKTFGEEKARVDKALVDTEEWVVNAGVLATAAQLALDTATTAYMDACTKYDAAKTANSTALTARNALDALAKEADSFVDSVYGTP